MEELPTFYSGDTISVEFAMRDDSGVSSLVAVFAHTNPGEYACRFVQARDAMGNYRTFHPDPDIRFRVENGPGDREGPQISNWRFSGPPEIRHRPWWRRLLGS
jgi:hypothetical protein